MSSTGYPVGVTRSLGNWSFQSNHVERPLDNASYEAAHPDDTLIVAGPARSGVARTASTGPSSVMPIGMFQALNLSTSVPVQPVQAIGSGRNFLLRGKSQTTWQLTRALINGRNLLRALYHNAVAAQIPVHLLDDPAAMSQTSQFFTNLDSELYYVPFGLGVIIRAKAHALVGSLYAELSMINSYATSIMAGQAMVAENVSAICDRAMPWQTSDAMSQGSIPRAMMDRILGMGPTVFPDPTNARATVGQFDDSGLENGAIAGLNS